VRAVVESAGIHDVLSKSLGTSNKHNIVHATIDALKSLRSPDQYAGKRGLATDQLGYVSRQQAWLPPRRASIAPPVLLTEQGCRPRSCVAAVCKVEGASKALKVRQTASVIGSPKRPARSFAGSVCAVSTEVVVPTRFSVEW
jgi:hypothetical protein